MIGKRAARAPRTRRCSSSTRTRARTRSPRRASSPRSRRVTGIVLTKLDGTAKGGVIVGLADELGIPVRYVGVGEGVEDLRDFRPPSSSTRSSRLEAAAVFRARSGVSTAARRAVRSAGLRIGLGARGSHGPLRDGPRPGHDLVARDPVRRATARSPRSTSTSSPQHFPKPGWVEHDAEEIWETQLRAARGVRSRRRAPPAADVAAIGITNQRETTVVWDRADRAADPPRDRLAVAADGADLRGAARAAGSRTRCARAPAS